ncbi:MAG: hypothetical protein HC796_09015 [Synechococcaceae cyanobacterium RL_1_2]|nr:hypothetical protein [Synechococcaceae cyanobacterium RL_1_2]
MAEETPNPMGFNFVDLNATTKPQQKSQDAPLTLEQTTLNHPPADTIADSASEPKLTNPEDQSISAFPPRAPSVPRP